MFKNAPYSILKLALIKFCTLAQKQHKDKTINHITKTKDGEIYDGLGIFCEYIITKGYRYCMLREKDVDKLTIVVNSIKNSLSGSKMSDQNMVNIKASSSKLIEKFNVSKRPTTIIALNIALVIYILLRANKK